MGFTDMSRDLEPSVLLAWVNELFSAFDELAEKHGVYKVRAVLCCVVLCCAVLCCSRSARRRCC